MTQTMSKAGVRHRKNKSELFYPSSKPVTRWWWFSCDIRETDIDAQLDWVSRNGFGGVEIAWIFPPRGKDEWSRVIPGITSEEKAARQLAPKWLSQEWSRIVKYAKCAADRRHLGCDFTFGTLWPFGDTHVPPVDASKQYDETDPNGLRLIYQLIRYSWEQPAEGLVIDHLSRKAFENYAKRIGEAIKPAMGGSKSALFCDSWEVSALRLWTDGFEDAFSNRFGYDVRPFMKDLWSTQSADVRYDYLTLISDLVIENFYLPLTDHAHKLGGFSRVQVSGAPVDPIRGYSLIDVPETEAMLFEPTFSRIVGSAAALSGRREISSESFTCIYGFPREYHLNEQVADLKLVADALFANGVNQIIWHGMPFVPADAKHDLHFYATVHVGKEGLLAKDLLSFNEYLTKVSHFMKIGRTYSDLALWLPVEDGRMGGEYEGPQKDVPGAVAQWEMRYVYTPEETSGYHPLWVTNSALESATVKDNKLYVADMCFRALYIDVKYLSLEGLRTISQLNAKGLPVVLKQIPSQPGRVKVDDYDDIMNVIKSNVTADMSQVVFWPPLVASEDEKKIPSYWSRVDQDATYVFLPIRWRMESNTRFSMVSRLRMRH